MQASNGRSQEGERQTGSIPNYANNLIMKICVRCKKREVKRNSYCQKCWASSIKDWYWRNREKILKLRRDIYHKSKKRSVRPPEPKVEFTNINPSEGTIKWIKFEGYYNLVNQLMADVNLAHIAFETKVPPEIIRAILRG